MQHGVVLSVSCLVIVLFCSIGNTNACKIDCDGQTNMIISSLSFLAGGNEVLISIRDSGGPPIVGCEWGRHLGELVVNLQTSHMRRATQRDRGRQVMPSLPSVEPPHSLVTKINVVAHNKNSVLLQLLRDDVVVWSQIKSVETEVDIDSFGPHWISDNNQKAYWIVPYKQTTAVLLLDLSNELTDTQQVTVRPNDQLSFVSFGESKGTRVYDDSSIVWTQGTKVACELGVWLSYNQTDVSVVRVDRAIFQQSYLGSKANSPPDMNSDFLVTINGDTTNGVQADDEKHVDLAVDWFDLERKTNVVLSVSKIVYLLLERENEDEHEPSPVVYIGSSEDTPFAWEHKQIGVVVGVVVGFIALVVVGLAIIVAFMFRRVRRIEAIEMSMYGIPSSPKI